MNLSDLLQAMHNREYQKLCKISPEYRESDRKEIATQTEEFLKSGKKITELPSSFSTLNKKAA